MSPRRVTVQGRKKDRRNVRALGGSARVRWRPLREGSNVGNMTGELMDERDRLQRDRTRTDRASSTGHALRSSRFFLSSPRPFGPGGTVGRHFLPSIVCDIPLRGVVAAPPLWGCQDGSSHGHERTNWRSAIARKRGGVFPWRITDAGWRGS